MNRAALAALAVVAAAGLLARSAAPVAACTCGAFSGDDAAYRAAVVVVGTVSEQRVGPTRDSGTDCGEYRNDQGAISVETYLKGSGTSDLTFHNTVGFCSGEVPTDQRLLMFLSEDGSLTAKPVDLCGDCVKNPELTKVEKALRLNPGTLYGGEGDDVSTLLLGMSGAVAALVAALVAVVVIRYRARRGHA